MKNYLFFCDTTYQLYTIITIVTSFQEEVHADLVVKHGFTDSKKLVDRIRNEAIFERIYEYSVDDSSHNKIVNKVEDVSKLILSKRWLKRNLDFEFHSYDRFYAANLDDNVALALYATVTFSEFYLFEDGTGSYRGNIIEDYMSWKRRALLKLFHPGKKYFQIDRMLLYAPEISLSTACEHLDKLYTRNDDRVARIFEYRANELYKNKIIFLDQSYALDRAIEITEQRKLQDRILEEELKLYSENVLLRPHPRMPEGSIDVCRIDDVRNLWEIECEKQITNGHILLSIYSSAAFQPALVGSKRPTLVFLYKIYPFLYREDQLKQIDDHIQRFKEKLNYSNIYIPRDWDEFGSVMADCFQTT